MTTFDQWVRVNVSSHYFDHVLRFVERARGAGSAVALLQIRSSPELEAFYDGSDLDPDEALARLRRETDLPLWAVPTRLARSEHFCDYVHLNEHARRLVSEWLITRIAAAATSL
jgi:hypothetical protein